MTAERKRQALGKGLGALIPDGGGPAPDQELIQARVDEVFPNPEQPRRSFGKEALLELAASIKEKGVLQPVLARRVPGGYELVAGERRFRAARLAGLETIPLLVKKLDDADKLELALIENIQRENLNPIEEAQAFRDLQKTRKYTQEEVARKVGKDRATVANALRLLTLPEFARRELVEGNITAGHARALLMAGGEGEVRKLLAAILRSGLSVRQAEKMATGRKDAAATGRPRATPETTDLERRLERHLGGQVRLSLGKRGGKLEIRFKDLDHLNLMVEKLLED